jgi:enoyl-CoA hydratase/carnithine racemase
MAFQNVLYDVAEQVATIQINRPEARNALNSDTLLELITAFGLAKQDPAVRVVVLTGAGDKAFCAGGDLQGFMQSNDDGVDRHSYFVYLFEAMAKLGKPIVGAVNGHCLAGGFGVALACDLLVASDKATFGTPEINVGLWPHMIMAVIFRNIGRKKGMELLMLGDKIDAATAERWNLINWITPHDQVKAKAREVALTLAKKSPLAMRMGRDGFYTQQDMEYLQALSFLKSQLALTLGSEDAKEGIAAFFEKREPNWRGR